MKQATTIGRKSGRISTDQTVASGAAAVAAPGCDGAAAPSPRNADVLAAVLGPLAGVSAPPPSSASSGTGRDSRAAAGVPSPPSSSAGPVTRLASVWVWSTARLGDAPADSSATGAAAGASAATAPARAGDTPRPSRSMRSRVAVKLSSPAGCVETDSVAAAESSCAGRALAGSACASGSAGRLYTDPANPRHKAAPSASHRTAILQPDAAMMAVIAGATANVPTPEPETASPIASARRFSNHSGMARMLGVKLSEKPAPVTTPNVRAACHSSCVKLVATSPITAITAPASVTRRGPYLAVRGPTMRLPISTMAMGRLATHAALEASESGQKFRKATKNTPDE
mmetsp:Transcript_5788/g.24402  ORF Transcript_5788/g.24402 Transcript_5788/m.24402 type:complete len:343 (+) Transcript_5788:984-2012(+)